MDLVLFFISTILAVVLLLILIKLRKIIVEKNKLQERFDYLQRLSKTGYFDGYFSDDNVWWSEELNKLIGLEPDNYITHKKAALDLIYEKDRAQYINQLENLIQTKEPLATEYRGLKNDTGELRHYKTNVELITDKLGNPIGLRGTVQDNTDKKEIQQALNESEIKQANVISNIDDLVFVVNNDGIFTDFYNSSSRAELYTTPEQFLNKHHSAVLPENISKNFDSTINLIKIDGQSRQFDYSIEINGEVKWNNVKVSVFKGKDGNKEGYIVVARDFTERKLIEEKLAESEKRFRKMTELLPVAVLEVDLDGSINYINSKTIEWFGYSEDEFLSDLKTFDLVIPEQRDKIKENLKNRIKNPDLGPIEYSGMKKSGDAFDVLLFASPIRIGDELIGFRGVLMDISERKKHQSELQKISKLDSLGILAGGIAHNFKNILAAITLSVDVIKMSPLSIEKQLNRIIASLEQANALATRFQTFTKSNEPTLESVNINEIIENSVEIALAGTSNKVELNLEADIFPIKADSKQLNEVILNLLINACQAMPKGGRISISTKNIHVLENQIQSLSEDDYIKIEIEDEGIGIEKDAIDEIFTPFYTTKKDGQGLGLPTVYFIIKNHDGAITVKSEINKGTIFTIFLRKQAEKKDEIIIEPLKENPREFKKTRVFLVDDDVNITNTMLDVSEIITELEIQSFNNPLKAISFFKETHTKYPFDIAILDMTLVGYEIDGLDVLKEIRKIDPNIKTLVFSGHSSKPVVSHYEEFGFDGRLEKPCNFEHLLDTILSVLNTEKNA
ncbi:MAG: PAS domain S-box protein [Candidatus Kapaibacterium sp.]